MNEIYFKDFYFKDFKKKLLLEREALLKYLLAKFENCDWHGVQDAASDLRDIDCQLEVIRMADQTGGLTK